MCRFETAFERARWKRNVLNYHDLHSLNRTNLSPICLFFSIPGKLVGPHPSSRWDRKIAFLEIKESCEKNPANICDDRYLGYSFQSNYTWRDSQNASCYLDIIATGHATRPTPVPAARSPVQRNGCRPTQWGTSILGAPNPGA